MTIREQLELLRRLGVRFVVAGGQAGVLRQAIEFSHDLDIVAEPTTENAERLRRAVKEITTLDVETATLLAQDFQQYIRSWRPFHCTSHREATACARRADRPHTRRRARRSFKGGARSFNRGRGAVHG